MKIKILNIEHGIRSCNAEELPTWVTQLGPVEAVAFFYFHQRDWIVLNEDHPNFELHKMVIENYMDFSDIAKKEFAERYERNFPLAAEDFKALNYINRIRKKLYQRMKKLNEVR